MLPHRVVLQSIGSATPHVAAQVGLGLGVPVPQMVTAFYRAPSVLVDDLDQPRAAELAALLADLGCQAHAEPCDEEPPARGTLFDVAVHVVDESQFDAMVAAVASFVGCSTDVAEQMLLATPALVLGGVTEPTVTALQTLLGPGATVLTSQPSRARFDLLLSPCPPAQRERLLADLRTRGVVVLDEGPWLARDLDKPTADAIWEVHRRSGVLRVANQDFYRFEVVLDSADATDPAARRALEQVGLPAEVLDQAIAQAPITIADDLSADQALAHIATLDAAGVAAHAELTTFLHLGLEVTQPGHPPQVLGPWPELTARVARQRLVQQGALVELVDAELVTR
ncbi:hypothetical protein [Aestuariimicrobium ganziense]|uniref:hypothetical protein n=1 Tax=Aestuariimicrobium ganziense TaxID=2773677 RepID=UPI001942DC21|nr:hypothetical protein [Aestuariimicrobium ganziense]